MAENESEQIAQSGAIEQVEEPTGIEFSLKPVKKKPSRRYRKGSKYDPLVEKFMKSSAKMVELEVTGKDANYLRTQVNKRIEAKKLTAKMSVSVVNNKIYLEKK